MRPGEILDPLPLEILRKYIAYAKKYVHPKLSVSASQVLKDFFVKLRKAHQSVAGNTPVTTRQLEACIRLTQVTSFINHHLHLFVSPFSIALIVKCNFNWDVCGRGEKLTVMLQDIVLCSG